MEITVKSRLLKGLPGPVERLFNGDDATDFFKGVTRVTDDVRKVQILAAMRQDGAIALPEVTEVEGCIAIAPNDAGEPTVPINVSLPLVESTWPHMAAIRTPGSDMYTDATMALSFYDLPNVKKLATGTFRNCEWGSLARSLQWNPPAWWFSFEEIESGALGGMTLGEIWEPLTLVLPPARRIGDRIFGEGTPESDQLTLVWGPGTLETGGFSASAFAGCGFNMDVQVYELTREEVERLANFPWGIADKSAQYPAKVFTADPPTGNDYWVVERDPATGKCRLVAP